MGASFGKPPFYAARAKLQAAEFSEVLEDNEMDFELDDAKEP